MAAFDYGEVGDWVLAFKHGARGDLAAPLARMMAEALSEAAGGRADLSREARAEAPARLILPRAGDLFVPVPLHPVRLIERGYDQAALLAKALAVLLGTDVLPILRRTRATVAQGDLAAPPRSRNVQGAFASRCRLPGEAIDAADRQIWLVDDVLTSGATASACAAALRRSGAPSVRVLALARA